MSFLNSLVQIAVRPFCDFLTVLLGVGKLVDERLVLEELVDVALGAEEGLEDGVLDLDEGLAVLGVLGDDSNLLLHLGFSMHYLGQHLLLEPRGHDGEADDVPKQISREGSGHWAALSSDLGIVLEQKVLPFGCFLTDDGRADLLAWDYR